jgi:hypothetical protein
MGKWSWKYDAATKQGKWIVADSKPRRRQHGRLGWRASLTALLLASALVMLVSVVGFISISISESLAAAHNVTATTMPAASAAPWLARTLGTSASLLPRAGWRAGGHLGRHRKTSTFGGTPNLNPSQNV